MAVTAFDSIVINGSRDYSRLDSTIYNRARLSGLNVMVVGAGALGNEVIKNLTLLGLGAIYIVDRDVIESSNLTRSVLYCVPHVQQIISNRTRKAEFAASRVREINPEVRCVAIAKEIADVGLGVVARMHLVFSCLDNESARLELSWACRRVNVPFVDAGLGTTNYSSGLISLFPGSGGPCYACRKGRQKRKELLQELYGIEDPCWMKERRLEEQGTVSTTPLMASVIGAIQVEMGLRHILSSQPSTSSEGKSVRVLLSPSQLIECFSFTVSRECSLHDGNVSEITKLNGHSFDDVSVAELISSITEETKSSGEGSLCLDWPLIVEGECRHCGRVWRPMIRKARFRREGCLSCNSSDVAARQVVAAIENSSPLASMTLAQLGLPPQHIHEVCWGGSSASRKYVEVSGDWRDQQ